MADFKNDIIPATESINWQVDTSVSWWLSLIDSFLAFIKDSIFWILALIAIWLFIYIGWKLIKANWNPEELKKAFLHLVHIIIGLFVVAAAFAIIKIVAGLNF